MFHQCSTGKVTQDLVEALTAEAEVLMPAAAGMAARIASLTAEEKEKLFSKPEGVRLYVYLLYLQLTQCMGTRLFTFWNVLKMFGGKPLVRMDIFKQCFYKCYICACMLDLLE